MIFYFRPYLYQREHDSTLAFAFSNIWTGVVAGGAGPITDVPCNDECFYVRW